MAYLYIKAIHIIFVVSWFSGLFYMVRFFVYHREALEKQEPKRTILHEEYIKNERLLYNAITTPAMALTLISGVWMIYLHPFLLSQTWFITKLGFLVGLLAYHFHLRYIMKNLREGIAIWSSIKFRLWNEVATIFLVAIVFIVILKSNVNWIWGTFGFVVFSIFILLMVKLVKYLRNKE